MPYKTRIKMLEESHRLIDQQIIELEKNKADEMKISELKKKKLLYRDELSKLNRLQWEEDHERVNFDDDR